MLTRTRLLGALLVSSQVFAQAPESAPLVNVPAMTPVVLRIDQELTSKKSKEGDRFPIHIDEDVRIGELVVIPAGATGEGEVIHARKSGMGGKAGELIVAARFVKVGDQEVHLRSLNLGSSGKDRSDASLGVAIVTGPIGLFVVGGVMTIPRDTVAGAKTAEAVQLPAAKPAQQVPVDTTRKGGDDESKTS